ncbi:MAG: hypothetical protein OIF56_13890 [Cohaesibacter sp.]|nr:hypothetical protein [Cohaesibacter sp.]
MSFSPTNGPGRLNIVHVAPTALDDRQAEKNKTFIEKKQDDKAQKNRAFLPSLIHRNFEKNKKE